ncbi:MAG: SDR family NAD(P)-dependent oxidoreductase, partial [Longimicrobiales bacterium]
MLAIDLRGKRALVTGGSRGIGRAAALLLGRAGADVGISYHSRHDDADAVVADLQRSGVRAWAEPGDFADPWASDKLFARVRAEFGRLDI